MDKKMILHDALFPLAAVPLACLCAGLILLAAIFGYLAFGLSVIGVFFARLMWPDTPEEIARQTGAFLATHGGNHDGAA